MTETPKSRAMSLRVTAIDKFTMFDVAGVFCVTPFFAFSRFVQLLCFQSSMDIDNSRWVAFNQGVVNVHEPLYATSRHPFRHRRRPRYFHRYGPPRPAQPS